jgi:hypothetical protein
MGLLGLSVCGRWWWWRFICASRVNVTAGVAGVARVMQRDGCCWWLAEWRAGKGAEVVVVVSG